MDYLIIIAVVGIVIFISYRKHKKDNKSIQPFLPEFGGDLTEDELLLVKRINNYRDTKELNVLSMEKNHIEVANLRVDYMKSEGKASHDMFFFHNRLIRDRGVKCAENVAYGFHSSESVLNAWKRSQGHNENLLKPNWQYIGVSSIKDEEGKTYYCLILGRYDL